MISPSNRPSTANSGPHVTTPIGGVDRKRRTGDAGLRTKALKGEKPSDWSNGLRTTRTVTAAVTRGACARLPSNLRIRWLSIGFGVGEISAFAEADPPGNTNVVDTEMVKRMRLTQSRVRQQPSNGSHGSWRPPH
jgi:hypothetical protein